MLILAFLIAADQQSRQPESDVAALPTNVDEFGLDVYLNGSEVHA
ncbi:MAG: hypothetical protein SGJ13_17110 [Actinomycetota bacterium]|nr:hypothetical protein [Actinomycetota bacterium]